MNASTNPVLLVKPLYPWIPKSIMTKFISERLVCRAGEISSFIRAILVMRFAASWPHLLSCLAVVEVDERADCVVVAINAMLLVTDTDADGGVEGRNNGQRWKGSWIFAVKTWPYTISESLDTEMTPTKKSPHRKTRCAYWFLNPRLQKLRSHFQADFGFISRPNEFLDEKRKGIETDCSP